MHQFHRAFWFVFIPEVDKLWPILSPQTSLAQKTERCFLKASIFSLAVSTQHQTAGRKVKKNKKPTNQTFCCRSAKHPAVFKDVNCCGVMQTQPIMCQKLGEAEAGNIFWSRKMYLRYSDLKINRDSSLLILNKALVMIQSS